MSGGRKKENLNFWEEDVYSSEIEASEMISKVKGEISNLSKELLEIQKKNSVMIQKKGNLCLKGILQKI